MKNRLSIILYKTQDLSHNFLKQLCFVIEENSYSDEKDFGFININLNFNHLTASLLKKTPTYISEFDYKTKKVQKKQIYVFSNVEFAIDAEFNTLEIYSNIQDAKKVFATFRKILGAKLVIEQVNLAPFIIFPQIQENNTSLKISNIRINNFNIDNKIYGNFNINSISTDLAFELIQAYKHDVKKATATLNYDNFSKFEISFSENGQIVIKSKDDIDDILYQIKSIIFNK